MVKRYSDAKAPVALAVDPAVTTFIFEREAELERRRGSDLADIWRYAARWPELAWRVTLNLHVLTHGQDADQCQVALATARNAWKIVNYYAAQQLAILDWLRHMRKEETHVKIFRLLDERQKITVRDVLARRILHSAAHAEAVLESMAVERRLDKWVETPARGGHSTTFYQRRKI